MCLQSDQGVPRIEGGVGVIAKHYIGLELAQGRGEPIFRGDPVAHDLHPGQRQLRPDSFHVGGAVFQVKYSEGFTHCRGRVSRGQHGVAGGSVTVAGRRGSGHIGLREVSNTIAIDML